MRCLVNIALLLILIFSFIGVAVCADGDAPAASAGQVNEKMFNKETIPADASFAAQLGYASACNIPALIDKKSDSVEYYRSADGSNWIAAGTQKEALQARYDKKAEVMEKKRLKRMKREMINMGKRDMQDAVDYR